MENLTRRKSCKTIGVIFSPLQVKYARSLNKVMRPKWKQTIQCEKVNIIPNKERYKRGKNRDKERDDRSFFSSS